jgi:hypothetical protein
MGLDLYAAVQQAGLPAPAMHMEILLEGDAECMQMPIDVLRSLHPLAQQHNVSLQEVGNLEPLPERVHTEAARLNTVVNVIPIVSAWAYKPTEGEG